MMDALQERTKTVAKLVRIAESGALSDKVKERCLSISERLNAPVLIGIFGPTGSGKRALLNELVGAPVLPRDGAAITLEVLMGDHARSTVRFADGTTDEIHGYPNPELFSSEATFGSVTSPECKQLQREILLFECGDDAEALQETLEWAAMRVDIAVWCTRAWTGFEEAAWESAPERLRDHAILRVAPDGAGADPTAAVAGFATVVRAEANSTEAQVSKMISEAREQDVLSAELFLSRYGVAVSDDLPDTAPVEMDGTASYEAAEALGKLFLNIRNAAEKILTLCAEPPVSMGVILEEIEKAFVDAADLLTTLPLVSETWPELEETILDAHDLAVLLKFEGGQEQVLQGTRLLVQVREEVEDAYLAHVASDTPGTGRLQ